MTKKEEVRYKAEEKKRHIILFAVVLFIFGVILIIIGTYAYYRRTLTGTLSGTIASWAFEANDSSTTFTTITLEPVQTTKTLNQTMAPGTSGSFDIVLSSVGSSLPITYTITFSDFTNVPTNLQFYSDDNFQTVTDIRTTGYSIEGDLAANTVFTKTIYWKWNFGNASSTASDNAFIGRSVSFNVSVVGNQKNSNQ